MSRRVEKMYQRFDRYLKKVDFSKFDKLIDKIKSIKCHPYYDVPPCPACRSFITGRYIKQHRVTEKNWIEGDALRKGEIIQFKDVLDGKNCFCASCGYEWEGTPTFKFINSKQLAAEKLKRHIDEFLEDVIAREDEEIQKRSFVSFSGFVGKL